MCRCVSCVGVYLWCNSCIHSDVSKRVLTGLSHNHCSTLSHFLGTQLHVCYKDQSRKNEKEYWWLKLLQQERKETEPILKSYLASYNPGAGLNFPLIWGDGEAIWLYTHFPPVMAEHEARQTPPHCETHFCLKLEALPHSGGPVVTGFGTWVDRVASPALYRWASLLKN